MEKKYSVVLLDSDTLGSVDFCDFDNRYSFVKFNTTGSESVLERIIEADVVITNKVVLGREVLEGAKSLKLVCVAATGYNNIDIEWCKNLDIAVCNVKGYSTLSVAQTTFSALFHKIGEIDFFDNYVKNGRYQKSPTFTCMEREFSLLEGKKFGVIGLGEIGHKIASIAKMFGADVCYYSTTGQNNDREFRSVPLEEMVSDCDFISVNCPLNEKTKNLLNGDILSKLKKDAILINFSRGFVVDEQEVARLLNNDSFGCYIADVYEKEPIETDNPLFGVRDKRKLVLTPHIGWAGIQAREKLVSQILQNIEAFFAGEKKNRIV